VPAATIRCRSSVATTDEPKASVCRGHGGLPNDTDAAGSHAANGYGLHDMAGNVWEWVNDGYSESYHLRVAYRGNYSPTLQDNLIGFRCAR
jgi:formylglycine-generating enzyme required for sulfatase activity